MLRPNFTPEVLLDFDESKGSLFYLVKWKGIPRHMSTWESAESLILTEALLSNSKKYLDKARKSKEKKQERTFKRKPGRPRKNSIKETDEIIEVIQDSSKELIWTVKSNQGEVKTLRTKEIRIQHPDALLDFLVPKIRVDSSLP